MPPRQTIRREAVEDSAFELVRREGPQALTARRIAQALGCSTQPVYSACGSMASVRAEVEAKTRAFVEQYLRPGPGGEPPLLQLGLASLRLAREEPHLFRLASAAMRERLGRPPPEVLSAMRADPQLAALSEERLAELHALLWVFSQGLATLLGPEAGPDALRRAQAMLRRAGEAFVTFEAGGAR